MNEKENDLIQKIHQMDYITKKKNQMSNLENYGSDSFSLHQYNNFNQYSGIRRKDQFRKELVKKISSNIHNVKMSPPKRSVRKEKNKKKKDDALLTSLLRKVRQLENSNRKMKNNSRKNQQEVERMDNLLSLHKQREREYINLSFKMLSYLNKNDERHPFKNDFKKIMERKKAIDNGEDSIEEEEEIEGKKSKVINMVLLKKRVTQLNEMVLEEKQIVKGRDGITKFGIKDRVVLSFYLNGLTIDDGAFRPYEWKITQAFLCDILDGYFPFEFKEKFPDGVLIDVDDRSKEVFTKGHKVGNELLKNRIRNMDDIKAPKKIVGKGLTKTQFLNRIPKQVIKNGEVINVRDEVKKIMNPLMGKTEGGTEYNEDEIAETRAYKLKDSEEYKKEVSIIKVRIPKGKNLSKLRSITIHMFREQRIGDLRVEIWKFLSKIGFNENFRIKVPPNIILDKFENTVRKEGLYPKAIVHVVV